MGAPGAWGAVRRARRRDRHARLPPAASRSGALAHRRVRPTLERRRPRRARPRDVALSRAADRVPQPHRALRAGAARPRGVARRGRVAALPRRPARGAHGSPAAARRTIARPAAAIRRGLDDRARRPGAGAPARTRPRTTPIGAPAVAGPASAERPRPSRRRWAVRSIRPPPSSRPPSRPLPRSPPCARSAMHRRCRMEQEPLAVSTEPMAPADPVEDASLPRELPAADPIPLPEEEPDQPPGRWRLRPYAAEPAAGAPEAPAEPADESAVVDVAPPPVEESAVEHVAVDPLPRTCPTCRVQAPSEEPSDRARSGRISRRRRRSVDGRGRHRSRRPEPEPEADGRPGACRAEPEPEPDAEPEGETEAEPEGPADGSSQRGEQPEPEVDAEPGPVAEQEPRAASGRRGRAARAGGHRRARADRVGPRSLHRGDRGARLVRRRGADRGHR